MYMELAQDDLAADAGCEESEGAQPPPPADARCEESEDAQPPPPPLEREICVRLDPQNECFDVLDRHDGLGYTLSMSDLEEQLCGFDAIEDVFHLVREDGTTRNDPRVWMAKQQAERELDGPPIMPCVDRETGVRSFRNLVPLAQYRLVVQRARAVALLDTPAPVKGLKALDIRIDDVATGEDAASCSCLEGNPCAQAYGCKDWARRFEVARRNGWRG